MSARPPDDLPAVVMVPALLTVTHVAKLLDCHPRTVSRRIDAGELPAVVVHEKTMVRADELRAYIDGLARPGSGTQRRRSARSSSGRFDFLRS